MHLANQSPRKLDKLSQSSMGEHPRKREATDPRGINECEQQEAEQRGMLGQGTIKNIGLPMLQEARN